MAVLYIKDADGNKIAIPSIKGADGIGIKKSEINTSGELILTYSDGTQANLGVVTGKDGKDGVITFKPVTELPTEDINEYAIYLLPSDNIEEKNTYNEYIYVDGNWELIGTTSIKVNMDEYVKFSDYANFYNQKYGVVKINSEFGVTSDSIGNLVLRAATNAEIDSRHKNPRAITSYNLDYAIKSGLTKNQLEWTEDEKASARELIGAPSVEDIDGIYISKTEINTDGELVITYSDGETANLGKVVGAAGSSGVYVGSGDMPDDCNIKIDPTGEVDVELAEGVKF